jgi:alcohol dehydrogenase class IV
MFPIPHGAACAAVLPHAMEVNVRSLRARAPGSPVLGRYDEVARLVTGSPHSGAEDGVRWIAGLCRSFEIPTLRHYGVRFADFPVLIERAAQSSSMKGNPIALTAADMAEILTLASGG